MIRYDLDAVAVCFYQVEANAIISPCADNERVAFAGVLHVAGSPRQRAVGRDGNIRIGKIQTALTVADGKRHGGATGDAFQPGVGGSRRTGVKNKR